MGNSHLFRSVVLLDLQPLLGTRQFQLSLGCGILSQSKILPFHLNTITQFICHSIRENYNHWSHQGISITSIICRYIYQTSMCLTRPTSLTLHEGTNRTFTQINNNGCLWWQETVGSLTEWSM